MKMTKQGISTLNTHFQILRKYALSVNYNFTYKWHPFFIYNLKKGLQLKERYESRIHNTQMDKNVFSITCQVTACLLHNKRILCPKGAPVNSILKSMSLHDQSMSSRRNERQSNWRVTNQAGTTASQCPHEWTKQHGMTYKETQSVVRLKEIHLALNPIEIELPAKPENELQKRRGREGYSVKTT